MTQAGNPLAPRAFDRAAAGFNDCSVLHREIGERLLERLEHFKPTAERILDLGCATGQALSMLAASVPQAQVLGLDRSPAMLGQACRESAEARLVAGDMDCLPLASRSTDLVFANLVVHWSAVPGAAFNEIRRILRPGGLFLFSTFGPDTLQEMREAWSVADDVPHVNEYPDMHDIGDALVAAGFRDPVMDRELLSLDYPHAMAAVREIRGGAMPNIRRGRRRTLTGRRRFQDMLEAWQSQRPDGRCLASFEVVYGAALAPAEGQPMRTGEGEVAMFSVDSLRQRSK